MKFRPLRDQISLHHGPAPVRTLSVKRAAVSGRRPHSLLLVILTFVALVLSACGSSDSGSGGDASKTIVFSVPTMSIAAMQQLASGVEKTANGQGWKVTTQDANGDPQQQASQLTTVISSGTADALWIVALSASSLTDVLKQAQAKGIPVFTNGTPEDYGFDGAQAGITFSAIDYEAYGTAVGKELGNCINEKLNGTAEVAWGQPVAGSAGKEEMEKAQEEALKATAPNAEIVSELTSDTVESARTDIGNALQGHPDLNAVMGSTDEVALGAMSAFDSAAKDLPCLVDAGGNEQVLQAVKDGKMYATVALNFGADIDQGFKALVAMDKDPEKQGALLNIPQNVTTANG